MFWSKIWFFLIALVAAAVLAVALLLPRPAQRALSRGEANRLQTACGVIHILLTDDARNRIDLAGAFARAPEIMNALEAASAAGQLDESRMKQARDIGDTVMKAIQGNRKPDFAMLIDRKGRVVARVRLDDNDFGDVAAGRPLVDDALAGYLRDDLWTQNGTMYFVSAAPVVKQGGYVGAVVLGHQVTNQLAERLAKPLEVDMGFHLGADGVAGSKTIAFDHSALQAQIAKLGDDVASDCQVVRPVDVRAGPDEYLALVARLPGEAQAKQAYYSVLMKKPESLGPVAAIKAVKADDLSFGNFPWLVVGGAFLGMLAIGVVLMYVESDRPLKRLTSDAVRLAKGETERLSEDAHGGKHGSIARSVNIHIDKLNREAKSAKKDLDQLLGPAPEGSLGTIDLLATALPSVRPGGPAPAVSPPPSEFRFQDSPSSIPVRATPRPPPARAATPPAFKAATPPPAPPQRQSAPYSVPPAAPAPYPYPAAAAAPAPAYQQPAAYQQSPYQSGSLSLDDDILGRTAEPAAPVPPSPYYRQVFDQFVAVKQQCGESTQSLVFERFAEKLVKNREDLIAKTGCRDVKFTVYVKDGKAALKATPIKDE